MRSKSLLVLALCAALSGISMAPARASRTVVVTVLMGDSPVEGAFLALTGTSGRHVSVTNEVGEGLFSAVADGSYAAAAAAPGTSVGTATIVVAGGSATEEIVVVESGNRFRGLGAYGAQTGTIIPDAATGVFYLTTTAIPSLYRTVDYGGTWSPVTISTDDPAVGIDGTGTASSATTSAVAGEIAAIVGGKVWFSRDFGITWNDILVNGADPNTKLYWGHVGPISILFMSNEGGVGNQMSWATMPTDDTPYVAPVFASMGSNGYRTSPADRIWMAPGSDAPIFAVAPAESSDVVLYAVDASPSRIADNSTTIPNAAMSNASLTFIRLGGPPEGPEVGTGRSPSTVLVYSSDGDGSARMSTYGEGVWTSTTTTTFHNQDNDATNSSGAFATGPSSCGAYDGAIGSVSPLGGEGTVGSCWLTQQGTVMHVRPVRGINNNTGMAFDAAYDGATNRVLISGDGQYGAAKSSAADLALNRPSFPAWPVLASAGSNPGSGGISITGLEAAVVKDTAYGPGSNDQLATMLSFSGGGRTLGSLDGGTSWITIQSRGGGAVDWWPSVTQGTSWILAGSGGDGNLLSAADVATDASDLADLPENVLAIQGNGNQYEYLAQTSSADLGMSGPGSNGNVSAIVGLPGTDVAYVGTSTNDESAGSLRKVTLSGSRTQTPDSRSASISSSGLTGITTGVMALSYCADTGDADASVRDTVFAALGTSTGGIAVVSNASGTPSVVRATSAATGTQLTGSFNDVRVDCATATVWAARSANPGQSGLMKSVNGGESFEETILANAMGTSTVGNQMNDVEALEVNPSDGDEIVAVSRDGAVAVSVNDGAAWGLVNDPTKPAGRNFGGERPGDIEIPPDPEPIAPTANMRAPYTSVAAQSNAEALLGSGSGLFTASVRDATAPSTPILSTLPLVQKSKAITLAWSAATDAQSGVAGYVVGTRRKAAGAASYQTVSRFLSTTSRSGRATLATGSTYCFFVRAANGVGMTSSASTERCTVIPANNTDMRASAGWLRKTAAGYYLNSFSTATARGATLTLPVSAVKRIRLIATTCPSCGAVEIYVGKTLLKRVSLVSGSQRRGQIFSVVESGTRSGLATIRVTSSNRPVSIEGLIVSAV
ncbi:MAG: hypothetical protein WDA27_04010 [Actinomycetota bacterium]